MVMFVSDRDPVCPGDRIGRDGTDCLSGSGTHVWQGSVVASVVGELRCERPAAGRLPVASVRVGSRSEGPVADVVSAIAIGDEVLCRVRRLNPRYATCDVLCRGTKPLLKNFSGLIRVQDVRATEIDKVSIISSFRPGDLVRAEVISLGEAQSLLLSTAKDSLGVLEARSEQGEAMVAVSDEEMACPVTKTREGRKCAKVQQFVAPHEAARPCREIREGRALQAITGLGMEAMESPSRGGGTFISSHLLRLPTETRTKVFASAASCQAVLRILSPIARHYCLRACFSGEVDEDVVANWSASRKNQGNNHRRAVESLLDLGVWKKVFKDGGKQANSKATYKVNEGFAEKLRLILQSGVRSVWSEPTEVARRMLPDAEELRRLSQRRWDSVLLFLAGGDGQNTGSGPLNLEEVLTRLGLLERTESSVGSKRKRDGDEEGGGGDGTDTESEGGAAGPRPALRTTPEGYQFLLRPAEEQVWRIVGEFLSVQCGLDGESGAAAVSFLLQLGFCEEGKVCKLSVLSGGGGDAIARVARALATLGLVYPFESPESPGEFWVLPTHLSKLLCGGPGTGGGQGPAPFSVLGEGEGIIVETNYRVYAYTKSPLRRAVLELFCLQEYVLPNLFVGRLARESCSAAFEAGISAELIVDYLNRNAHPQVHVVRSGAPVLPETVADGVRLWEVEARRLSMSECAMYDKFESRSLFLESLGHAKDHGKVLWVDEAEMKMVVQLDHHNSMKAFIKEAKMKL